MYVCLPVLKYFIIDQFGLKFRLCLWLWPCWEARAEHTCAGNASRHYSRARYQRKQCFFWPYSAELCCFFEICVFRRKFCRHYPPDPTVYPGLYIQVCISRSVYPGLHIQVCISRSVYPGLHIQVCVSRSVYPGLYIQVCISRSVYPGLYIQVCISRSV